MRLNRVFLYRACDKGGATVGEYEVRTDAQLIHHLQRGDIEALGELFKSYKDLVYRTGLGITRDERAAEDILQDCFVRLYKYAASVDPDRPLTPWLYRVTVNLAYDWSSKNAGAPARPLDEVLEWLSGLSGAFPPPDRRAEARETMRMVREVIADLPAFHRAVIVLFYVENLPVEQIAEVLELPTGTVKSRLYYARERLRDALIQRQRPVPEMEYEFT